MQARLECEHLKMSSNCATRQSLLPGMGSWEQLPHSATWCWQHNEGPGTSWTPQLLSQLCKISVDNYGRDTMCWPSVSRVKNNPFLRSDNDPTANTQRKQRSDSNEPRILLVNAE